MVTHRERIMGDTSTRRLLSACAAVLAFGTWYSLSAPHDWSALDRAGYDTQLPLERIALSEETAPSMTQDR
ncbi:hypothetical protein QCE49_19805 [Caballeronia sp. LZ008]|uniref:hypothetical protein n=2 Tax=unclassified Caballeronia TaxID=2646786 RepID=UPI0020279875|nr:MULTISPECIES: hypothetical protein [unclassified Caballeronia]MDR5795624.1 hypothetical protein [Caballeronia sp. LZ008]